MHRAIRFTAPLAALLVLAALAACAPSGQRMGMVKDPETGILYGSMITHNLSIDPAMFQNKKIKVVIRNTSGDANFDLYDLRSKLEKAYASKGYIPTSDDDFGLRLDVNVHYSGQIRQSMTAEGALIGAAAGGVGGYAYRNQPAQAAVGAVSGATVGAILGSYATDNTYIILADIKLGIMRHKSGHSSTTVVFEGSQYKEKKTNFKTFDQTYDNGIAAYAGGRLVDQKDVVEGVRGRFLRILSDVI